MLLYFTIESLTYGMHCLITLWPQGVFLVSNVTYLIMQTMLEMTFLLLVTISIVWYVFSAFNNLFFNWWGEGTSKWRFGSSLVCHVFYLLSRYFVKVINWQKIDWLIDWTATSEIVKRAVLVLPCKLRFIRIRPFFANSKPVSVFGGFGPLREIWRHPQKRKYITYCTVVRRGPSHGHR